MEYIPCAFVNGNPIKFGNDSGYLVTEGGEEGDELVLHVLRKTYYKHPDAPDDFMLEVREPSIVTRAKKGDENYAKLYLLMMAQENIKGVCVR